MQSKNDISLLSDISALTQEIYKSTDSMRQSNEMSAIQFKILKIWQQILGFEDIGVDDDLFKVGGDSIASIQIFSEVNKEFGVNIPVQELFSTDSFSIRWLSGLVEKCQIDLIGESEYSALLEQVEGMSEAEIDRLLSK